MAQDEKILRLVGEMERVFDDVVLPHTLTPQRAVPPDGTLADLLSACRIHCTPIDEEIQASNCVHCDRFIGCQQNQAGAIILNCWGHKTRVRLARGTKRLAAVQGFDEHID
jgi:hypothetical protein